MFRHEYPHHLGTTPTTIALQQQPTAMRAATKIEIDDCKSSVKLKYPKMNFEITQQQCQHALRREAEAAKPKPRSRRREAEAAKPQPRSQSREAESLARSREAEAAKPKPRG